MQNQRNHFLLNPRQLITKKQRLSILSILENTDQTLGKMGYSETKRKSLKGFQASQIHQQNSIDKDYLKLLKCFELKINQPKHIMLQPYLQSYFSFDMGIYMFPLFLQISNITSEGTLFIGFNLQHPCIQDFRNKKIDPLSKIKIKLDKQQSIPINQPGNRNIQKLYFLFQSGKDLLQLRFRLISNLNDQQQLSPKRLKRSTTSLLDQFNLSQSKSKPKKIRVKTETTPIFSHTTSSYLSKLQLISNSQKDLKTTKVSTFYIQPAIKDEQFDHFKNITKQYFHKRTLSKSFTEDQKQNSTISINNRSINNFLRTHIHFTDEERRQISKKNLEELQKYKEKTQKLQSMVEKFKTSIQLMKKEHDQRLLKSKKLLKNLLVIIKLHKFMEITHSAFIKRKKKLSLFFMSIVHVNRFCFKLKAAHHASQKLIPNKIPRLVYGLKPITNFLANISFKKMQTDAQKIILKTFKKLHQPLLIRQVFNISTVYMQKILKVQRMYKSRYDSQKRMLLNFCNQMIAKISQKFPHFKKFILEFKEKSVGEKLILSYIKDENLKHNERLRQYRIELSQRKQIIEMKGKLELQKNNISLPKYQNKFNQKKSLSISRKRNQKSLINLQIPRQPTKPVKSLFRNLNILQSMIRNWFQMQNFVWTKKQKAKKWY